jgi:hypothetical protein
MGLQRPPRGDRIGGEIRGQRSPVREALVALGKEDTVIASPYKGAIVKPLSGEEVLAGPQRRTVICLQPTLIMPLTWRSKISPGTSDPQYATEAAS